MDNVVSIIIPVYNTEKYIEQCLDSVIGQTYRNIEIILVLGNSSDRSDEICAKYAEIDKRIRIVVQEGSGAGAARNQGAAAAKGDYICFVDSDDWVDGYYVEKLLNAINESGAELAECDYYWGNSGVERIGGNSPYFMKDKNLIALLGTPPCWKFMYKREAWVREDLRFSNTVAEDLFLFLYAYRVCKPQCILSESLYYYRVRQGSFTETGKVDVEQYKGLFSMISELIDLYKLKGIWEQYEEDVCRMFTAHIAIRYRAICGVVDREEQLRLKLQGEEFFVRYFNKTVNCFNRKVYAFGSYNLGRISNIFSAENITDIRYGFSSIISLMSGKNDIKVVNSNTYRLKMIEKDMLKTFADDIKHNMPNLLLIDFLEERNDIVDCGDGYITASEVFYESVSDVDEYKVLSRVRGECDELWKHSCDRFVDLINSLDDNCRIVLVEMYLSEYIGTIYDREYNADEYVRTVNKKLCEYYDYFERKCPRAMVIRKRDIPENFIYTEKGFEHGELPMHYNYYYYDYISNMISDIIA